MDNDDTEATYAVYCYYRDGGKVKELIESGLSLEDAKALVKDPESSSRHCSSDSRQPSSPPVCSVDLAATGVSSRYGLDG